MLIQHLLKLSVFSLNYPSYSTIFLFMILLCTQKFLALIVCALFSSFNLWIQAYILSSFQLLDSSSLDLRSQICFMRESSRKDMRSFRSFGSFFLQSYQSCFQRSSLSYFRDFIQRLRRVYVFLRFRISVVFSCSSLLMNLTSSLNLSSSVRYSFSFFMLNLMVSSSLKPASRFKRITSSQSSIISLFFSQSYYLRSAWHWFTVDCCSWQLADSVSILDLGYVLSVRSELRGVQQCFSLVGVLAMRMNKSSALMKFIDILCSLILSFDLFFSIAPCSALESLILLL